MVVEAIQWNGVNRGEIESFCGYENVEFKKLDGNVIITKLGLQSINNSKFYHKID